MVQGLLDNNRHQHYLYLDLYSTRDFYILSMQPKYHVGNFLLDDSWEMINGAIILFQSIYKLEILKHLKSVPVPPQPDPFCSTLTSFSIKDWNWMIQVKLPVL